MKKILVPIKRVPDYAVKVTVNASGDDIKREGIKWIINPFDEIAVEECLRIRESGKDVEIVVITIGIADAAEQLRAALAMGADRAIHVVAKEDLALDSFLAANALSKVVEREKPDLVVMGKQSIDSDANQTGQLLAAAISVPQATFASKVTITDDWSKADVVREVDGGLETLSVTLPAVITTDLRLNEPRYPSLPGIVQAKKKPLEEIAIEDLSVELAPRIRIRKLSAPEERSAGIKVGSVSELVEKLKTEAKVL